MRVYHWIATYSSHTIYNSSFTVLLSLSVVLYPRERIISFEEGNFILLECLLADENSGSEKISWSFNGQSLSNSDKHTIALSEDVVCPYGTCDQSQLQIRNAMDSDTGTYTCHYRNLSAEIIVMNSSK